MVDGLGESLVTASPKGPLEGLPLLEDLPRVSGRKVLLRCDFNVPLTDPPTEGGPRAVADDFRIRAAMPTIEWLTDRGASVTACTHLGRPDGKPDPRYDVAPVRARLKELAPDVELMQNLRFDPGEKACDPSFVDALVEGFDLYVNDAFGASHRSHASIVGPPTRLPSAAGRIVQREVEVLGGLLGQPARPFVAVVGGAKVEDKLGVLSSLLDHVDRLLVGGAMAFTFLAAQGHSVGASLFERSRLEECRKILESAGDRLLLPVDLLALGAEDAQGGEEARQIGVEVPDGWTGLDIGPTTAKTYAEVVLEAGTVFWNGPMGKFEDERFAQGTSTLASAVAHSKAFTVVGGGDSAASIDKLGLSHLVDFVSTGGGASLRFLESGDLVGLAALRAAVNAPR